MEQTPRGVKVKPTIGIGLTTYKRDVLLQECLDFVGMENFKERLKWYKKINQT